MIAATHIRSALVAAMLVCTSCNRDEWGSSSRSDDVPDVAVAVMIDLSKSFAPLTAADRHALEEGKKALVNLATANWPQPVSFYFASIGSDASPTEPCGAAIIFKKSLLAAKKSSLNTAADLGAWFDVCIDRIFLGKLPLYDFTDVSAAVGGASKAIEVGEALRVIVILSDFSEDLAGGRSPFDLKLNGEDIVMLYRPNAVTDAADSNLIIRRIESWKERFKAAGAHSACDRPVKGLLAAAIQQCLPTPRVQ